MAFSLEYRWQRVNANPFQSAIMFKNYLKIAWRNIERSRLYSAVSILGLAIGIAFSMLIGAFVWSQLQVNQQLKNADRQYIILSKWKNPGEGYEQATVGALAKALKENYPALVANYYRFDGITSNVSKGEKSFRENIQVGDSNVLTMFGFPLLYGNAATALQQPFTAVITQEKAIKYFGKTDVVGKTITIENFSGAKHDFQITGVLATVEKNTITALVNDYPNDIFLPETNLDFFGRTMDWQNPFIASFIELQPGVKSSQLDKPMHDLFKQNAPEQFLSNLTPKPEALTKWYLRANNGLVKKMMYALSAIAFFILLMAVINFVNMAVSRSAKRMREIGIRKVLGGLKTQLVVQFLAESVILTLIATLLACVFYTLCRDMFGNLLNSEIPQLNQFPFSMLLSLLVAVFSIGLIAGLYPAFVLSSLKSVESLKGKIGSVKDNILLRKTLVGFQFGTATIAFTGAIIISQQVQLFLSESLGFNKDYVLSAQLPRDWTSAGVEKMLTVRNELEKLPFVNQASLSYEIPDGNNAGQSYIYRQGSDSTQAIPLQALMSDEHYVPLYKIQLLAGTGFEGNHLDSGKILINETAAKALGWKDAASAAGAQIRMAGDPTIFTIQGVTSDFHFGSMQQQVAPLYMANVQFATVYRFMSFKLKPGNMQQQLEGLQKKWSSLMPGAPFEYKFMDESLAKLYRTELQLQKAAFIATLLAIVIVLLGVAGLVSMSIQKRTTEIGVRKVLGSSVASIISLFIKEFMWVLVIGSLVACPIAYLLMHSWLQTYAYRVHIGLAPFAISLILPGIVTALLIALQTTKAALANPAKSLRTE